MTSIVAKIVEKLQGVIKQHPGTLRNVITTMFVFSLEALISTEGLFNCPLNGHGTYGYMFIIVPALAVFLISLILSESFEKVQGCCYTDDPKKQLVKKYCPCSLPRWGCSDELFKLFFYSLIASCLWIFWALLEKKYYTCAVVGSRDQLKNVTGQNKTDLEERFRDAEKDSQIYGFMLVAVILGVTLLFLTLRRCCCQRPISSIPILSEYEKMEAASAEETLKGMIETHATKIGKAKANKYFSQNFKVEKSKSDIIREVRLEFTRNAETLKSLEEYKKDEAKAVDEEFKKKAEELAKERVAQTFEDKAWREYEDNNPYDFVENVYKSIRKEYPRSTGDRSKPYKNWCKQTDNPEGIEMTGRH